VGTAAHSAAFGDGHFASLHDYSECFADGDESLGSEVHDFSETYSSHTKDTLQGGSNMTGTDLCVNKPHCAAAVRP